MDMQSVLFVLIGILLLALLTTLLILWRRLPSEEEKRRLDELDSHREETRLSEERRVLERALGDLKADVIARQAESFTGLRTSLDSAQQLLQQQLAEGNRTLVSKVAVFGEMERKLGELARQAQTIETVGKGIQSLSELLRPPKVRGALGELFLEHLLAQILPANLFSLQYTFPSGTRVDAVIHLGDRVLPIDAKFPMESFQRLLGGTENGSEKEFLKQLKGHVDTIESKYLRQGDLVTRFALIYIPSEAVYAQFVGSASTDALEYALARRVVPTSPGHLYAFLSTLASLNAELSIFQRGITKDLRWLLDGLHQMEETISRLVAHQEKMDGSIRSLSSAMEKSRGELATLRRQHEGLAGHVQPDQIDATDISPALGVNRLAGVSVPVSDGDAPPYPNRLTTPSKTTLPAGKEESSLFDNMQ